MTSKSKRRPSRSDLSKESPAGKPDDAPLPPPHPPQPNKRLLLASAVLLLGWFCFLGWMALFN